MFGRRRSRRKSSTRAVKSRSSRRDTLKIEVESHVARDISAIIYFAVAAITTLSIQNKFGIVGELWNSFLNPILGWGIYLVPVIFFLISVMLFFSKRIHFGFSRVLGLILLFISSLSILHLSVPIDDIYALAEQGQYGGYTGFVTNFLFRQVLKIGNLGASVVLISLFLISLLLTFSVSFRQLAGFLNPHIHLKRQRKVSADSDDEKSDEELEEEFDELLREETPIQIHRTQISSESMEPEEIPIEVELEEEKGDVKKEEVPYVWEFPSLDLLNPPVKSVATDDEYLKDRAEIIRNKLKQFDIEVMMHEVHVGPTVIQFTLRPSEGVKLSKITALKSDIALALAAKAVRIEAPIPGKSLVGVEIPNDHRTNVHLREILESKEFKDIDSNLRLPLGRDVSGKSMVFDLTQMPHILIAGATGSGKSVGLNSFLIALLYQNSPKDMKLIMIDPKRVELASYNSIPHLLSPVVTDPEKAAIALRWVVAEMQRRYLLFSETRHRNVTEYNEDPVMAEKLPKIVVVVDELADLMMVARSEVEASICRIAQMARAVGIHLIVATQRPSVDVITGLIKANIPARIAYAVSSSIDSRTILDGVGAEDLLGKGDMLFLSGGMSKPIRIQGIYMSTAEIERVTNRVKLTMQPQYNDEVTSQRTAEQKLSGVPDTGLTEADDDELYSQALGIIRESRKASASLLQRRLKVGYARAARLLDIMEQNRIIGPARGAKPREIYFE